MSEASAAIHAEFAPGATTIQMMLRIGTPVFGDDAAVSHAGRMTAQGAAGGRRGRASQSVERAAADCHVDRVRQRRRQNDRDSPGDHLDVHRGCAGPCRLIW